MEKEEVPVVLIPQLQIEQEHLQVVVNLILVHLEEDQVING